MIAEDNMDFSMRNIAKECKISQGTIYIHFKNKGELLASIMMDDWHVSLKKMEDLVTNCESFAKGLTGFAEIIRDFSKPYYKVWDSYKTNETYTSSKHFRHKELIDQIKAYVEVLTKRFLKNDYHITSILSEVVLGCATSNDSFKELENLAKAIMQED